MSVLRTHKDFGRVGDAATTELNGLARNGLPATVTTHRQGISAA